MRFRYILPLIISLALGAQGAEQDGYLFATFRGEATPMSEQIYFMASENGRDWKALNDARPVLVSTLGEKGVRDPFIVRSPDGHRFYLIATDLSIHLTRHDWKRAQEAASKSIVVWQSEDLVNWSEPRLVKVAAENAGCAWAPEATYDASRKEYLVYWASKTSDDDFKNQQIWAAWTKDFETFSQPFLYVKKPTAVIDTTIVRENGVYYRFTKDEKFSAITMETSADLTSGWKEVAGFTLAQLKGYEGPACFMIEPPVDGKPAKWCLLLDFFSKGRGYQPYITDNLSEGKFVEAPKMNFPFHPVRHGTVMPVTREEMERLNKKWGPLDLTTTSGAVKANNIAVDRNARTIELPVMPGTDLANLDPKLNAAGMSVSPQGPQNFSNGPVEYTFDGNPTFKVAAVQNHNPALAGYFADPDCIYSRKTGKYYAKAVPVRTLPCTRRYPLWPTDGNNTFR